MLRILLRQQQTVSNFIKDIYTSNIPILVSEEELDEYFEEETTQDESVDMMGVREMLQIHRENEGGDNMEYGYSYEEDYI